MRFRFMKLLKYIVDFFKMQCLDDRKKYRHSYEEYLKTCAQHVSEDFFPSFQSHIGIKK